MSCCGWTYMFFRPLPEEPAPQLSPAQHAQNIRNAIPAAVETIKGLQALKLVIIEYTQLDHELFNAINGTLPLKPPFTAGDFDVLYQVCDKIEANTERGKILTVLEWANY